MKKTLTVLMTIILVFSLTSCSDSQGSSQEQPSVNTRTRVDDPFRYPPYDQKGYIGLDYQEVETLFRAAGFENINFSNLDDIDSNSGIADGTVETVRIKGTDDYTSETGFDKNDEVLITYHSIPKIAAPLSSEESISKQYMDVGKLFYDAGFHNVETDEIYDLPAGTESQTELLAGGKKIDKDAELVFDSNITVLEHYSISQYPVVITVDFLSNLIFSKYDVNVTLGGVELGTLPHGEDGEYTIQLPVGSYELVFSNDEDEEVKGSVVLDVNSKTEANYQISCHSKNVDVKELSLSRELKDGYLLTPNNSWHYLRKDYKTIKKELQEQGFTNVTTEATTDMLWGNDKINTAVGINIDGKNEFTRDQMFSKSAPVKILYHTADFSFEQNYINVTEKDTFELPYTLTSGDSIDSIIFNIDHPDLLQRNSDGSFTSLKPGTATVSAYNGGELYSECVVESAEIIVPIEKIEFGSEEIEVSVGSTFKPEYSIIPNDANYTDMKVEISNNLIEAGEDNTFYSSEEGDTEITFYQDERLLGSCVVHSVYYAVEDLTFEETSEEILIGDTLDLGFTLLPEKATNKGISVTSSNTGIAEVTFDERGASVVNIVGKSAGEADIVVTIPDGSTYTYKLQVKEIVPEEIILANTNPKKKIEVGTPVTLSVSWKPDNTSVKELTWNSSNNNVIKVDAEGNLETVGVGNAEIVATHKSGTSASISLTVEPTPVKSVDIATTRDNSSKLYAGNSFTVTASVSPENATDHTLVFSSSNESVAKVNNQGVVTAVGVGDTTITVKSPDGPSKTIPVTVSPSPQRFRINYSAYLSSNDHVGYNWSSGFEVNNETFYSGNTIVLDPEDSFTVYFWAQETDSDPDYGRYSETITYSDELCKNGYSVSTQVYVSENRGRYSGHSAIWNLTISIVPVR